MTVKQLIDRLIKTVEEETYLESDVFCYDKSSGELTAPDEVYCNKYGDVVIAGYEEVL